MEDYFYEDLALKLLEMNLNGDSLNKQILKDLFKEKPHVLDEIFGDETTLDSLDAQLYSGRPDIVEVRDAKKHELWECIPCGRTFRRKDNLDRHLRSSLHERRLKKYNEKKAAEVEQMAEDAKTKSEEEN